MYKTFFLDHRQGGYELQCGKTQKLEEIINLWDKNGYDFVSIAPCPYLVNASRLSYVLVFKQR